MHIHKISRAFDTLERKGLNPTIRVLAENAVVYRKLGAMGGWKKAKTKVMDILYKRQPDFARHVLDLLNEA